ncbi:MAG: ATP-binding protein [candidate division KSB1 bacterium]|nr:ATP-binding protein [candidate division KSB1 bacterium]
MTKLLLPQGIKRVHTLKPRWVIIVALIVILIMVVSAVVELSRAKKEVLHLLREEATLLIAAISSSGINAILAYEEIENLVEEKLLSLARSVELLDRENHLSSELLATIARENDIYQIQIFDSQGRRVLSNHPTQEQPASGPIAPLLNGQEEELIIGFEENYYDQGQRYIVGVKRHKGGAITVSIDALSLLNFRKEIGVGRLMQDIGGYEGIAYIVLQDEEGIIMASKNVVRMPKLTRDPFLMKALKQQTVASRIVPYESQEVFEVVTPFIIGKESYGLFRVGLKMGHVQEANARTKRRLLIMSLALGVFGIIIFNFVMVNQNYTILNDAYRRIQTYTGNILENMADSVIAIDRHRRITVFNRAAEQLFQIPAEQALGKTCRELLKADISPLERTLESGESLKNFEMSYRIGERNAIVSLSTSVLFDNQGQVDTAIAVIKDLTEQKALEENLHRKEKLTAMGELASGVAHEIRNPLNAIGMVTQRLAREFEPRTDVEEYQQLTQMMVNEVRRINEIIQQFLRFARPPELNLTKTDVNELIQSTLTLVSAQARNKNITLEQSLQPVPKLFLDQSQIKQVLLNLLQNSLEATNGGGRIGIQSRYEPGELILTVADTGVGIPRENLTKIFNLYFTTKQEGTGLGLSLVHQIISQHNGRIHVESEVGQGTKVVIYLPVNKGKPEV